jgi:hypothetical protein
MAVTNDEENTPEEVLTPYPNPFTESFTMKVKGQEGEKAQVAVFTGSGMPVENFDNIPVNSEHVRIGVTWQKGSYIIKVRTKDKVETYHVIKN